MLAATLASGCHVVLEGPPGTGKSTLLRALAAAAGLGVELVEGNAELTPARLVGHHDPALVLEAGYRPDTFVDGPLLTALREGSLLYIEELNRVPEETLNVLVGAAFEVIRKGGTEVITGLADPNKLTVQLPGAVMTLYEKTVKGTLFGSGNPMHDIRNLVGLYQAGKLKLDELVTRQYSLDQINEGYQDLLDGKNIRGVMIHEH